MHRSGTSALAASLEAAGVVLGPVSRANRFNPRGNHELPAIVGLHEQVLHDNGGSWRAPPAHVAWDAAHRAARDRVVAGFAGSAVWGFKDPRTLFTLDGWRAACPGLRPVGVFRHPRAVAASLTARDGLTPAEGLDLWLRYNERLLDLHREQPFPLLCFDEGAGSWRISLRWLMEELDLHSTGAVTEAFDDALRHQRGDAGALPAAVARIDAGLRARAHLTTGSER